MENKKFKVGVFHCDICKKDITVYLITKGSEILKEKRWRDTIINDADNHHWYTLHYNCAVCGKWIPPKERRRIRKEDFRRKINGKYNPDKVIKGLLRVHSKCLKKLEV